MYWIIECDRDDELGGRTIESWPQIAEVTSWISGARFTSPIPQPIELYWDPEDEAGPAQSLYLAGIPMMTRALYAAITRAGVDNIDIYDVIVRSKSTGEENRDFVAFNVVGLVRAADMDASIHEGDDPPLIAVGFTSVVIDEAAASGLLFFRLAENVSALVVHDSVKKQLEPAGFGLTFMAPEDWFG